MHKILTIGKDAALLESRARILSKQYSSDVEDASKAIDRLRKEHFDLLLVCYSIPHDEASAIIRAAHDEFSNLCIVRLLSLSSPPVKNPIAHRVVTVDYRPETWIRAIRDLLTPGAQAPFSSH